MDRMAPRLPFRAATDFDKFLTSQILQVLSWFPVAKVTPSECHADANEKSKCPHSDATVCKDHVLKKSADDLPKQTILPTLYRVPFQFASPPINLQDCHQQSQEVCHLGLRQHAEIFIQ